MKEHSSRLAMGRWSSAQTNAELAWRTVGTNAAGMHLPCLLRILVGSGSNLGQKTTIMTGNFHGCYEQFRRFCLTWDIPVVCSV